MKFLPIFYSSEFWAAIIGGIFVLIGTLLAAWINAYNEKKNKHELLKSLLTSISVELKSIHDHYKNNTGKLIENLADDLPFDYYYHVTQNYFTIYDNNTSLIGHIKNTALMESIISIYINIKSLIDGYKLNNTMLELESRDLDRATTSIKNMLYQNRVKLAHNLKTQHSDLTRSVSELQNDIEDAIDKNNF